MPYTAKRRHASGTLQLDDMRDPFSIDVDRILHSKAYTSYTDKTQVFSLIGNPGISHRVIHVQLLSRIARTIGRKLGLNEDLIEAIAIGHDIGHPPFGHDGEKYLDRLCMQSGAGHFRHNVQGIQAVDIIEKQGKGLNLTLEVMDGILCHNGEMTEQEISPDREGSFDGFDHKCAMSLTGSDPLPMTPEGCLIRVADTISYIGRDIEDAIALGIIDRQDLPGEAVEVLGNTNGRIVYSLVDDVIGHSSAGKIAYSSQVFSALKTLKRFNYENIYLNPLVKMESRKIETMYDLVFLRLFEDIKTSQKESPVFVHFIDLMDKAYQQSSPAAKTVRDFMAGLTDSAFLDLFKKLYVPGKNSMFPR
ncbi:MAG: HD domain-containing protein [Thermodesulfobacteriota bacterium]|nr:HD domain-containing protein [Thermodesulfobacteriota bacterium]